MNVHKRVLSILLSIALVFSIFSLDTVGVYADQPTMDLSHLHDSQIVLDLDSGSIMFTAYGYNAYTFGDGIDHCFDSNATIIIRQSRTNSTPHTIMDDGTQYPVNLTLDGVNIDVSNVSDPLLRTNNHINTAKHCAFCLSSLLGWGASYYHAVNLTLKDSNYLKSGSCFAGLQVDGNQTLNIDGDGSLTATGGLGAAGIGSGANIDQANSYQEYGYGCGTINIHGGTVTANGGPEGTFHGLGGDIFGGAGIGGGAGFSGVTDGTISISGGTVTANGNGGGAGIGGGALSAGGGSGGTVSIRGGTVTAIGSTALAYVGGISPYTLLRSAGIGGAGGIETGGSGGTITISGGTVTAKSGGAAMEYLSNAPKNDNFDIYDLQYGGSFSQGGQTYHIYYEYTDRTGYVYHATWESGSMDHILQVPADGAAIGSGGIPYNNMQVSEGFPPHTDSGNGGTITISGGTVTAESTETTDNVLGGADIGNSEASYYYKTGCTHYTLNGSCRFTGGSINTHLTGNFAASPAPTDGSGNLVYKTTAKVPDIHTPTAVTVTPEGGSVGSPAQTDNQGNLYLWLPATANSNTVLDHIAIDGTSLSYEAKGAVTTDGASQLTVLRTDPGLDNLTFDGQKPLPTSTPGTYQVNVGSGTTGITIQKSPTSDVQYTINNGTPHSGTESVTVPISALETDLNIHIVGQTAKDYVVHIMRAPKNDTALTSLAIGGMPRIPDANGEYRVAVVNSLTSVKVCAVPEDPGASYTVLANGKTLTPGADGADVALGDMGSTTDISVVVRAEDGTTQKTYRVFILRSGSRLNDLISVLSPAGASVSGRNITASVDNGTASIPVNVTASTGATWELYSDPQCLQVIANNTMALQVGTNTAYLKILSQDGSSLSVYTLTVVRAAADTSRSGDSSHETPTPSLPTSLTNAPTNATVDLSGAVLPAGVTNVTFAVTPETPSGAPTGTAGGASDPQGAAAFHIAVSAPALNIIGTPVLYNIKLLDQNGNPISSFTGSVTVKLPIPAGLHGTPHVFRYEESTGTLTDLGAAVQNGFLVFSTTHFSYYVVAGTGDSITLDTKDYQLPVSGTYQIGLKLTGGKAAFVKVSSTNEKAAAAARLKNGNVQVTGKGIGTAYVMIDVYDRKNHLLTHTSVRIDVKTGIRPRGDSTRQIGLF